MGILSQKAGKNWVAHAFLSSFIDMAYESFEANAGSLEINWYRECFEVHSARAKSDLLTKGEVVSRSVFYARYKLKRRVFDWRWDSSDGPLPNH
jgi:hypothetical protein